MYSSTDLFYLAAFMMWSVLYCQSPRKAILVLAVLLDLGPEPEENTSAGSIARVVFEMV